MKIKKICWLRFLGFLQMVLPMRFSSPLCWKPITRVQQHPQHPSSHYSSSSFLLFFQLKQSKNSAIFFSALEKELSDVRESRKTETEKLTASLGELKVSMQKQETDMEVLKKDKTGLEREVSETNKLRMAKEEELKALKVRTVELNLKVILNLERNSIGYRCFVLRYEYVPEILLK